jgi:phage-related holin
MKILTTKYFLFFGAALISFFAPIAKLMFIIGLLVTFDIITGVIAAKKRGEKITSKKLGASVTKTILYFITIILGQIMQNNFLPTFDQSITKAVAGIFAVIEFKSNLENISSFTGIDLIDRLKAFLDEKRQVKKDDEEK